MRKHDFNEFLSFIVDRTLHIFHTGGDWGECYELVMKEAREKLKWSPGTNRVLVMVGDAHPHPPRDYDTDDDFKGQENSTGKRRLRTKKLLSSVSSISRYPY